MFSNNNFQLGKVEQGLNALYMTVCQRKCPEGHQNGFIAPDVELIRKLAQLSLAFLFSTPDLSDSLHFSQLNTGCY